MGQEGFTPLPFPPGFYIADTMGGKETSCPICLVPGVCGSGTFHLLSMGQQMPMELAAGFIAMN